MKRLSLQWRITLMTALLICLTCVLINCLVGYSGMRYMDSIGTEMSEHSKAEAASPNSFDPTSKELDDDLTIVVSDAPRIVWCDELVHNRSGDATRWRAGLLCERACVAAAAYLCSASRERAARQPRRHKDQRRCAL